jgi:hypothetical protein
VYLGLRKVVVFTCWDLEGSGDDDGMVKVWGHPGWGDCETDDVWWRRVQCDDDDDASAGGGGSTGGGKGVWSDGDKGSYFGWPCQPVRECQEAAINSQFGAFSTCVTLIFALIGCLTRMRKVADTNFQKVIDRSIEDWWWTHAKRVVMLLLCGIVVFAVQQFTTGVEKAENGFAER